jgi:hypothetical protein
MIILLYGQPCSGKTTIGKLLYEQLSKEMKCLFIDGDEWRKQNDNYCYTDTCRKLNLKSAFEFALSKKMAYDFIILAFVCPYEESREILRKNADLFLEIYLYYEKTIRGREPFHVKNFEEPNNKVIKINTSLVTPIYCLNVILLKLYVLVFSKYLSKKLN